MKVISLLFFFSGIAALTYEVLWVRYLGLIFGNTVYAAATVMMTYMFGLALGAHFSGKWAKKVQRPVRFFGILELATATYAFCIPLVFELIKILYRLAALHISDSLPFLTVVRVLLALFLLLIPTAMMGATLPILSKGFLTRTERFASRLGILYGVNTLGAVSGVLLSGFVLIPLLGMTLSNIIAVALDATVGLVAIALSKKLDPSVKKVDALESASLDEDSFPRGRFVTILLFAIAASGFLSLAFEVVWFRALILIFGSTTYSFSAMLSVFLIGLSVGSLLISRFADKIKSPVVIFGVSAILIGLYTIISLNWFTRMPDFLLKNLMLSGEPSWIKMISLKFQITFVFLFIPTILFGAAFTSAVKSIRLIIPSSSRAVGDATMFNTIGAALGAFVGGFILLPNKGMLASLVILAVLVMVLGVILMCLSLKKWHRWFGLGLGVLGIFLLFLNPPHWDKKILSSGPYFGPWNYVKNGKITLENQLRQQRLLYFNEGITSTISVIKDSSEDMMYCSQGKVEADSTERSMMLQRMMGHLPMLFHPDPQRVLNIGLGAGVTFGAVTCYPAKHLEVVEFEPSVTNVARIWRKNNHNVLDHPRVTVTINDGRNHLFVGGDPYDVITSDPFEPVMAGAANLYTVDFFELAKSRLADGGIMAQYLPLYELSNDDFQTIMRSFSAVFPDALLFFTGFDTIMLGRKGDHDLKMSVALEKMNIPAVRESLAEVGFSKPEMILSMFVARLSEANALFKSGKLNTDNHPIIEFSAPKHTFFYMPDKNQQALLENYSEMPEELMSGLSPEEQKMVKDSHLAMKNVLEASILRAKGKLRLNIQKLLVAIKQVPENPVVKNELKASLLVSANSVAQAGYLNQAILQYEMVLKYAPREFLPILQLADLNIRVRNVPQAKRYLTYGLQLYPDAPMLLALRGRLKGSLGDLQGAKQDLQAATKILPDYIPFWIDLETAMRALGEETEAERVRKYIESMR